MRNKEVAAVAGVIVGAVGVVALGFLLKKFLTNEKVEQFEEELVAKIVESSPVRAFSKKKKKVVTQAKKGIKKLSKLATAKLGNANKLLASMKKGTEYTQVMLEEVSRIPYRSVRRYVEVLAKQGKIIASGYGKGKKFAKKS